MMVPDLVVGEIGFGNNFADNTASLEAQLRELIRSNNRLIRVLKRCVKPSSEVANEASDAIEEAAAIR
jgi:preprotein translocase subunit Sss1